MFIRQSQLRVALPILAATVVTCVGLYFLLSWQPNREARRGFDSKAETVTRVLASNLNAALEFDDASGAQSNLESVQRERSVLYLTIRKPDGTVFAAANREKDFDSAELRGDELRTAEAGDVHHVSVPIKSGGRTVGWLQAGYSLDEVRQAFVGTRTTSLIVAVLVSIAGFLIAIFTGRSLASRMALLGEIAVTAGKLRHASENIQSACNDQAAGSSEQAAAIEETRQTMSSLLEAAKKIADASQEVFKNADQTSRTTSIIADSIKQLTNQAQKISDISEVIRSISDKSDLLALNASLEGTKAGEAGKGFALVAVEMRRLAETVMTAAREIKELVSNIRVASASSVAATEEGRQLAERTSESAREITLVTTQQRNATEQVTRSMDEVNQLLRKSAEGNHATEVAAQALSSLADQLSQLTSRFELQRGPGAKA